MSLEAKIESLTAALSALTDAVLKGLVSSATANTGTAVVPVAAVQPAAQTRQRRAAAAPVATPEPAPEPVADDGGFLDEPAPAATPDPEYTLDQVRAALVAFQKATNSQDKARKLLKEFGGVDTLQNLPKDKYGAVIKAAKI